jgi:hypothetical protein
LFLQVVLINQSDCDVRYELHHRIAPEKRDRAKPRAGSSLARPPDDDGGGAGGGSVALSAGGDGSASASGASGAAVQEGLWPVPETQGRATTLLRPTTPLLSVDKPSGILPAHSRTKVQAAFQPQRAGDFDIALVAMVATVDEDGNLVSGGWWGGQ